jgi:hypothetical protein
MSEPNETKKTVKKTNNYVKTFRCGAVAANIFVRQAPGGFEYLDFSLSRAWKTANGKEGYSQNFFAKSREPLHAVIDQACLFIQEQAAARGEGDEPQEEPTAEYPDEL